MNRATKHLPMLFLFTYKTQKYFAKNGLLRDAIESVFQTYEESAVEIRSEPLLVESNSSPVESLMIIS